MELTDRRGEIGVAANVVIADLRDDVSGGDARLFGTGAGLDIEDICAFGHTVIVGIDRGVAGVDRDAEIGFPGNVALGDKVVCDVNRIVYRDGKADAFDVVFTGLCGNDTDDLTGGVVHGTAGVAGVYRCVKLEHIYCGLIAVDRDAAVEGTYAARRHGEVKLSEGVADCVYRVADENIITVADCDGGKPGRIYLQDRNVVFGFDADDACVVLRTVLEDDGHGAV